MSFHVDVELRSLNDLRALIAENPNLVDQSAISASIQSIATNGMFDPFAGYMPPSSLDIQGTNYRETVVARKTSSRGRGVLLTLSDVVAERGTALDVYACESVSPFSDRLREIFGFRVIGSEYLPSPRERAVYPTVRHEDVHALSFISMSFDAYINCEVLEHVPDLDRALSEAHRILRPSGVFLGTVPFNYGNESSVRRARLRDGEIEHLMEPEYHGNPVDPSGGSLVFEIPGWDFLDRCRAAGFQHAAIRFIASTKYAIHGAEIAGIFVFVARA